MFVTKYADALEFPKQKLTAGPAQFKQWTCDPIIKGSSTFLLKPLPFSSSLTQIQIIVICDIYIYKIGNYSKFIK